MIMPTTIPAMVLWKMATKMVANEISGLLISDRLLGTCGIFARTNYIVHGLTVLVWASFLGNDYVTSVL